MEERSKMQAQSITEPQIKALHDVGAHLVLCRDKVPIHKGCYRKRPSVDSCVAHDGTLGLIPFSLDLTALDVDHGDWRRLPECKVSYPTQRGRHLYYTDDKPRRSSNWTLEGCAGEVRGAHGHIIPWADGLSRIADGLTGPRQGALFPFPFDLLQKEKAKLLQSPHKSVYIPGQSLELEQVFKGERHKCYFEVMRLWAYGEVNKHRDRTQAQWSAAVLTAAQANNQRFPVPLKPWEVRIMAESVAEWTWANFYDHSPERQRQRRAKGVQAVQAKNRDRNLEIVASSENNATLAAQYRLSVRTIRRIRNNGM